MYIMYRYVSNGKYFLSYHHYFMMKHVFRQPSDMFRAPVIHMYNMYYICSIYTYSPGLPRADCVDYMPPHIEHRTCVKAGCVNTLLMLQSANNIYAITYATEISSILLSMNYGSTDALIYAVLNAKYWRLTDNHGPRPQTYRRKFMQMHKHEKADLLLTAWPWPKRPSSP